MAKQVDAERLQADQYKKIFSRYEMHYDDIWSTKYRLNFFLRPMVKGISLSGKKGLEAMCGSGSASQYLVSQGADMTGLDISEEAIQSFRQRCPQSDAVCVSILHTKFEPESFDFAVVVGGLHHLHPNLNEAILEIHRILKPGGYFCFAEPHSESWLDSARRLWYKFDNLFAKNEASINLGALKNYFAPYFHFQREKYGGNVAYLAVWNSLVLRIPEKLKFLYSPLLIFLERGLEKLQGKRLACFVVCQWQKK